MSNGCVPEWYDNPRCWSAIRHVNIGCGAIVGAQQCEVRREASRGACLPVYHAEVDCSALHVHTCVHDHRTHSVLCCLADINWDDLHLVKAGLHKRPHPVTRLQPSGDKVEDSLVDIGVNLLKCNICR